MDQDKRKEIINSSETQEDLGVREDGVQAVSYTHLDVYKRQSGKYMW